MQPENSNMVGPVEIGRADSPPVSLDDEILQIRQILQKSPDATEYQADLGQLLWARFEQNGSADDLKEAIMLHEELLTRDTEIPHVELMQNLAAMIQTQFELYGQPEALDRMITLGRDLLLSTEDPASALPFLALALQKRFRLMHQPEDLKEAVEAYKKAVTLCTAANPQYEGALSGLANALMDSFQFAGQIQQLTEAIEIYRKLLILQPSAHPSHNRTLSNYSVALLTRFQQTSHKEDIDQAITLQQEICAAVPASDPQHAVSTEVLAIMLQDRFEMFHMEEDIKAVITHYRKQLSSSLNKSAQQIQYYNSLGRALKLEFDHFGNTDNLADALAAHDQALSLCSTTHPAYTDTLISMGICLRAQFLQSGDISQIKKAISYYQEVISLAKEGDAMWMRALGYLANALADRFDQQGSVEDIDEAIALHTKILKLDPKPDSAKAAVMSNLATAIGTRFQHTGNPEHLNEEISLHRQALQLQILPNEQAHAYNNLGNALWSQFQRSGDLKVLNEAVTSHQAALKLRPEGHSEHLTSLNNLAVALWTRYERIGDIKDLRLAIVNYQNILKVLPEDHPSQIQTMNNLANALTDQYHKHGNPADIKKAITLYRKIIKVLGTNSHPQYAATLNGLALALQSQFQIAHDNQDLDESINLHKAALDLRSGLHPQRAQSLVNLANAYLDKFHQQANPAIMDIIVNLQQESLDLRPLPHANHLSSLTSLANSLWTRFTQLGNFADIDKAIELHRQALTLCENSSPSYTIYLNSLAIAIWTRFKEQQNLSDILEAISLLREALVQHSNSSPEKSMLLNNLAVIIRSQDPIQDKDIQEAIDLHRKALTLSSPPHEQHNASLIGLANALWENFRHNNHSGDIDEAIKLLYEALTYLPPQHSQHSICLNSLAITLGARFEKVSQMNKDIDEAIEIHQRALRLSVPPNPYRHQSLHNLAISLDMRNDSNDKDSIIKLLHEAAMYPYASLSARLASCLLWTNFSRKTQHESALEACKLAIELLPQVASLDLDLKSRLNKLSRKQTLAFSNNAASIALEKKQINLAIEFLEATRSTFWSQALMLRTPLSKLASLDPQLYKSLHDIAYELEKSSFRDSSWIEGMSQSQRISIDAEALRSRELNKIHAELVAKVQHIPGLEAFLKPQKIETLLSCARKGPVVVLLATDSNSTALIITPERKVQQIILSSWSHKHLDIAIKLSQTFRGSLDANDATSESELDLRLGAKRQGQANQNKKLEQLLNDMWTNIAQPVIQELKLQKTTNPQRIWWCPTGNFTFLPIHASGIYHGDRQECLADYAISSYAPTLTTLLAEPSPPILPFKVAAVIEPNAQGNAPLPGTKKELKAIEQHLPSSVISILQSPNHNDVLKALSQSAVVHFACHGVQNAENPLESGLKLSDGQLTVRQLMQNNEHQAAQGDAMSLAFLSACETAKGDKTTPDEAMHLAGSLLFSGFHSIVATLWSINDIDGPQITDTFYKYLFKKADFTKEPPILPDLLKSAEALHYAVLRLREEKKVDFIRWVPFVHYGL